jgi:hypothetical protein
MAFDELISPQAALLQALTSGAWDRWKMAANRARTSAYTIDDLFEDVRSQFVDNWDAWNRMMGMPTETQLPTVTIQARYNALSGLSGQARVHPRLTNMDFLGPPLEQLGGAQTISAYSVGKSGAFDGYVNVTLAQNVPAPAGSFDVYRGLVLTSLSGANKWTPLSWVVVVANL